MQEGESMMSVMQLIECPLPNICLLLGEFQSLLQMLMLVLLIRIKENDFLYCFLERICFFLNSPFFLQIIQITFTPPVFPPSPNSSQNSLDPTRNHLHFCQHEIMENMAETTKVKSQQKVSILHFIDRRCKNII